MVDSVGTAGENFEKRSDYNIYDFIKLVEFLCGPDGCPWDLEQVHDSIKRNLLEEAYETVEAIENNDTPGMIEELGDILMQILFHADIARRAGEFDLDKIADTACKKLISRHPHVFGSVRAKDGKESLVYWEKQKREEKFHTKTYEVMLSVARNLPELWRAEKIQKKAAMVGFDWPTYEGALESIKSELGELEIAISEVKTKDRSLVSEKGDNLTNAAIKEEIGDLLFSVVNLARFFDVDPEDALGAANAKFISRFKRLETEILSRGDNLSGKSLDELELIYQQVKLKE